MAADGCALEPVRDQCQKLWQEWEGLMLNAQSATSTMFSSLRSREEALAVERAGVHALRQDVDTLRSSFIHQMQEQEKKVLSEKDFAIRVSKTWENQLAEVKHIQCQLADQLANLRSLITSIKGKVDEDALENVSPSKKAAASHNSYHQPGRVIVSATNVFSSPFLNSASALLSEPTLGHHRKEADASRLSKENTKDVSEPACITKRRDAKGNTKNHDEKGECEGHMQNSSSRRKLPFADTCHGLLPGQKRPADFSTNSTRAIKTVFVKSEPQEMLAAEKEIQNDCKFRSTELEDELDHILLSTRLELLIKNRNLKKGDTAFDQMSMPKPCNENVLQRKVLSGGQRSSGYCKKMVPIEIALQEDAPGLLEKLQEKGLMEDLVVYSILSEEDSGFSHDHFIDLESIMSKVWGTPTGLFKFPQAIKQHLGFNKGPSYCLSCLVSLVEQTRSLKQRHWPVEWGWCRELQAFLFVFEKHNRIVLERPEYGNATYFFEIVQPLPVNWQVRRLITVLSVTALGKTALLENRALQVGADVTVDEALLLEGYGWTQNMGLGAFLNFCDRVVHDHKDEDNAEWRQKIGKCLMDGYDRGRITIEKIPKRLQAQLELVGEGCSIVEHEEDKKPDLVNELNK